MSFIKELHRRNVFRVGAAYVIVAWLLLQVARVVLINIAAPTPKPIDYPTKTW